MRCTISRELIGRLLEEAAAAQEREVCGLLLGSEGRIEAALPVPNAAANPADSFMLDPPRHLAASRAAREAGTTIVGSYHSHPAGPAVPSPADAEQAGEQGRYWLILACGSARLWRSRSGGPVRGAFDEVALEVAPSCALQP